VGKKKPATTNTTRRLAALAKGQKQTATLLFTLTSLTTDASKKVEDLKVALSSIMQLTSQHQCSLSIMASGKEGSMTLKVWNLGAVDMVPKKAVESLEKLMSAGSKQTKTAINKVGTLKKSAGVSCCTISTAVQTVIDKTPGAKNPPKKKPTTKPKPTPGSGSKGNTTGNATKANSSASSYTFTGLLTVKVAGANKSQLETATKKSLAKHFDVAEASITTKATESRRLSEFRKLAGTWSITYSFTVSAAKAAAVQSKADATKNSLTALTAELKTQLVAAGVPQTAVDAMTVSGFTSTKAAADTPGTTGGGEETASPAFSNTAAVLLLLSMRLMIGDA
jgi:hypothetical protein